MRRSSLPPAAGATTRCTQVSCWILSRTQLVASSCMPALLLVVDPFWFIPCDKWCDQILPLRCLFSPADHLAPLLVYKQRQRLSTGHCLVGRNPDIEL